MNTYLLPWSTKLDALSRLHTTYKLYTTVTGRLSGDLQQVPRDSSSGPCLALLLDGLEWTRISPRPSYALQLTVLMRRE
jgi:hypothetical protein